MLMAMRCNDRVMVDSKMATREDLWFLPIWMRSEGGMTAISSAPCSQGFTLCLYAYMAEVQMHSLRTCSGYTASW